MITIRKSALTFSHLPFFMQSTFFIGTLIEEFFDTIKKNVELKNGKHSFLAKSKLSSDLKFLYEEKNLKMR